MTLHTDQQYLPPPYPPVPLGANALWMLTDFTERNGATHVVPGSHRSVDRRRRIPMRVRSTRWIRGHARRLRIAALAQDRSQHHRRRTSHRNLHVLHASHDPQPGRLRPRRSTRRCTPPRLRSCASSSVRCRHPASVTSTDHRRSGRSTDRPGPAAHDRVRRRRPPSTPRCRRPAHRCIHRGSGEWLRSTIQPVPRTLGKNDECQWMRGPHRASVEIDFADVVADRQARERRVLEAPVRDELEDLVAAGRAAEPEDADRADALRCGGRPAARARTTRSALHCGQVDPSAEQSVDRRGPVAGGQGRDVRSSRRRIDCSASSVV